MKKEEQLSIGKFSTAEEISEEENFYPNKLLNIQSLFLLADNKTLVFFDTHRFIVKYALK